MTRNYHDFIKLVQREEKSFFDFFKKREQKEFLEYKLSKIWEELDTNNANLLEGKTVKGIYLTNSGLIASTYFIGAKDVMNFIFSKGKIHPQKKNTRRIEDYLISFGDFDVSKLTKKAHREYFWESYSKKYVKIPKNICKDKLDADTKNIHTIFYKLIELEGRKITKEFKKKKDKTELNILFHIPNFFINPKMIKKFKFAFHFC